MMASSYTAAGRSVVSSTHRVNQDGYCVKIARHGDDQSAMVLCCDGMGGLDRGELASATAVRAFDEWFMTTLSQLIGEKGAGVDDVDTFIERSWGALTERVNTTLSTFGASGGFEVGTTLSALLCTRGRYHIVHVGDSRVYLLENGYAGVLTRDQTLMARELEAGNITLEEAREHPRRSTLLQCVGCSRNLVPAFLHGDLDPDTTFLLCSDGFSHELASGELYAALDPAKVVGQGAIGAALASLVEVCQMRGETDDITAVALHVAKGGE